MKKFLATATFCLSLLFVLSVGAFAQGGNGSLTGTVEDSSKALIPGVKVTALNTETGIGTVVLTLREATTTGFPVHGRRDRRRIR